MIFLTINRSRTLQGHRDLSGFKLNPAGHLFDKTKSASAKAQL